VLLNDKVVFPPVALVLHWPDRWSPCCQTEVVIVDKKIYECVSCGKLSAGRTQYVEGTVRAIGDKASMDSA
jgi:hypothetical protein